MKVVYFSFGISGIYTLVNEDKELNLKGNLPANVALWEAAQLAMCLDCPLEAINGLRLDPYDVDKPTKANMIQTQQTP